MSPTFFHLERQKTRLIIIVAYISLTQYDNKSKCYIAHLPGVGEGGLEGRRKEQKKKTILLYLKITDNPGCEYVRCMIAEEA